MNTRITALFLVATLSTCQPQAGTPEMFISAKPSEINSQGEEAALLLTATDGFGKIGKGQVKLTSTAGPLKDGVLFDIDPYGLVKTPFTCEVATDPGCVDQVTITAEWRTEGKLILARTNVHVLPPPPPPWELGVTWDSNARTTSCSGAGQPNTVPCTNNMCAHGFSCINGQCELNGGGGGLQYTLRFGQSVDLDLHVVEPQHADGLCDIYWDDPNAAMRPSRCGTTGSLDLDSNAGCNLDNVNIEHVIFPANPPRPAPGTYIARVDLWAACMASTPISWELEVRAGATHRYYCGVFNIADQDRGGSMSGLTVSTIVVP